MASEVLEVHLTAALVGTLLALMFGQSANGQIAGSWTAELDGITYVRLNLHVVESRVTGTIAIADSIRVDPRGELQSVTALPQNASPLLDARVADSVLSFSRKDGDDVDRFELRLTSDKTADLTLVLDDESRQELAAGQIPTPKPFRLKKVEH